MSVAYAGAHAHRELADGRDLIVYEMIYTWRLCVGQRDAGNYDRAWCYEPRFYNDVVAALSTWDGRGDPPGRWLKEVGTERRRHFDTPGNEVASHDA